MLLIASAGIPCLSHRNPSSGLLARLQTSVERENSSVESILSFGGVVQVYHRLQVLEEEEKGRKEEQEIERENQSEENSQMTMYMEMR